MHRFRRKSWFRKWTLKGIFIGGCAVFICALSIVFAAQMGQLGFTGIARVHEYSRFPLAPVFQPGGGVAVTSGLPTNVEKMPIPEFDGQKLTLYLQKPASVSPDPKTQWNGGNPVVSFTLQNIGTLPLTNGQVSVSGYTGGNWNSTDPSITASLSDTTVTAFGQFNVDLKVYSAISVNTTDFAKVTISFDLYGDTRSFDIYIYFVPNLYGVFTYTPAKNLGWTNQNVIVTLTTTADLTAIPPGWTRVNMRNYTREYSANSPTPISVTITNGTSTNTITAEYAIDWIDKTLPTLKDTIIFQTGYTTITTGVLDAADAHSGVAGCRYSVDNGVNWVPPLANMKPADCTSYQITGLKQETSYLVQYRVYDVAGNFTNGTSILTNTRLLIGLPLSINRNDAGYYFNLGSMSTKLTAPKSGDPIASIGSPWDGEYFTMVLAKPSVGVNGNETVSFTSMPITNSGDDPWTNGTVSNFTLVTNSKGFDPPGAKTTATISSVTVNSGATVTFTFNLTGFVVFDDIDLAKITVSFVIAGISPNPEFKVLFYFIPATGYMFEYNANGGTGRMPGSICPNFNAACAWNATNESGVRANGFTAPGGKTFQEWNTSPSGNGTSYAPGGSVPAGRFTAKSDNVLYAIWQ